MTEGNRYKKRRTITRWIAIRCEKTFLSLLWFLWCLVKTIMILALWVLLPIVLAQ